MALPEQGGSDHLIHGALQLLRTHLGLDLAVIAHLVDDHCVYRYVNSAADPSPVRPGSLELAHTSYARHIVDGRLPRFLRNAAQDPVAVTLPATHALPVATHLSVPIVVSDGSTYGTLSCLGHRVSQELDAQDLDVVRTLGTVVSGAVEAAEADRDRRERRRTRLRTITLADNLELHLVFQPIVALDDGHVVGVEALSRFPALGNEIPQVFEDAHHLHVGLDLELRAVARALDELPRLPDDTYLAINVGPETAASPEFLDLMRTTCASRIVVEITEHDAVEDYEELTTALAELCDLGVRLAIDDVGTGFAGLDQILRLSPHTLKIDGALVAEVDTSPEKQAMIAALVSFANRVDTTVVAEHIETAAELATLRILGVAYGQGYHFGGPRSLRAAPERRPDRLAP